jgi:hypothetical protein
MFRRNVRDPHGRTLLSLLLVVTSALAGPAAGGQECRWEGTGPFCDGQCEAGWTYTGQRTEDGCWSGSKRLCCRPDKTERCGNYLRAARDHIRILQATGCLDPMAPNGTVGLPGSVYRWGTGMSHFDWCMAGASDEALAEETRARADAAAKCQACGGYADAAANDNRIARDNNCIHEPTQQIFGLRGPAGRWFASRDQHFRWCVTEPSFDFIHKERDERAHDTVRCQKCTQFAYDAWNQGNEDASRDCGIPWANDRYAFYQECIRQFPDPTGFISSSISRRANELRLCVPGHARARCSEYAERALQQRAEMLTKQETPECKPEGPRWAMYRFQHYDWCLAVWRDTQRLDFPDSERTARDDILRLCKAKPDQSTGPAPGQSSPEPPPQQQWVARYCKQNVELTIQCQENLPAYNRGCGATEEEAVERAKISFGACFEEGDDRCCTYTSQSWTSQCDCGMELRPVSQRMAVRPGAGMSADFGQTPPATRCYSNMVLNAAGRCECPTGTNWAGSRCLTFALIPTQKVPSGNIVRWPKIAGIPGPGTRPTVPARPTVTGIAPGTAMAVAPRCRWPRPIGTPPNCCPLHTYYSNGACRALARVSKPTVVAPPTVVASPTVAVPGRSDKPQRQSPGASGTAGAQPRRCPPSRPIGTPPYCCQRGAQYINGVGCRGGAGVVRAQATPSQCAEGMIRRADGSCGCPQGLTGTGCKFPFVK